MAWILVFYWLIIVGRETVDNLPDIILPGVFLIACINQCLQQRFNRKRFVLLYFFGSNCILRRFKSQVAFLLLAVLWRLNVVTLFIVLFTDVPNGLLLFFNGVTPATADWFFVLFYWVGTVCYLILFMLNDGFLLDLFLPLVTSFLDKWILVGQEKFLFGEVGLLLEILFKNKVQLTQRMFQLRFFSIIILIWTHVFFIIWVFSMTRFHLIIVNC